MGKGLSFLGVVVALILSAHPLEAQQVPDAGSYAYRAFLRTAFSRLERFAVLLVPFKIPLLADGGGDGGGGGGDGGGGDGGGSGSAGGGDGTGGDSTGGESTSGDSASAADAAAAAAAAADDAPDAVAPPTDPATVNNAVTPELSAIEDIATTDPRGGFTSSDAPGPGGAIPSGRPAPSAPVDVAINAVIVSAAQSPWDAISKAPGVRNVIVTGGIVALGKTPIPGEIPGGGPQPAWLRVIPDLRLLDGSAIPPVVPNVIDIRIMNCPIKVIENPSN